MVEGALAVGLDYALFAMQVALAILIAPLVNGIIKKTKAFYQSRQGPSIFQPYYDIAKLCRKDMVISETTSWLFRATPYIAFVSVASASIFVPIIYTGMPLTFAGDIIVVIYLFAVARFFVALSGLDAGSSFGGMGSSREMFLASIAEPAMLMSIFIAAITAGSTNLSKIAFELSTSGLDKVSPMHIIAMVAFVIIAICETARIPFDNPATHLELTMVHEAMILEYSGKYLAMIEWGASIKQLLLFTIFIDLFVPWGIAGALDYAGVPFLGLVLAFAFYIVKLALFAVLVGSIESSVAKWRLFRAPDLLIMSFVLSMLALIFLYAFGGGA